MTANKTSRLYDPAWQKTYLGEQGTWNVTTLHLVGHPVSPAQWYALVDLYAKGLSPVEALATVFPDEFPDEFSVEPPSDGYDDLYDPLYDYGW